MWIWNNKTGYKAVEIKPLVEFFLFCGEFYSMKNKIFIILITH